MRDRAKLYAEGIVLVKGSNRGGCDSAECGTV